ncbi:arginase family protein [Streptomyces sulphureus]|uniref:arginase family protein n=1 Tax=Streptomyces sulphureus TaxID=47758 RepID=UPI0003803782|nr:arginase family protein [Streptomyces sulphureus]
MTSSPLTGSGTGGPHLRLVWPEWQGAGAAMVGELLPEFPHATARRGYVAGNRVLQAMLPAHDGPSETVPVPLDDEGLEERDGVEAKAVLTGQLAAGLELIGRHDPARITTLGGDCSVSLAPFSALAHRYGDDLAVVWIDSHPDIGTPDGDYPGYHAMPVAHLTGHGDPDVLGLLPATVAPHRIVLTGLHEWTDDAYPHIERWGVHALAPEDLRTTSRPLLDWLAATGCTKIAVHFDVDTIDSNEMALGLGKIPGGLTATQVRRIATDLQQAADVVAFTVAEFVPRDVLNLHQVLSSFPLVSSGTTD